MKEPILVILTIQAENKENFTIQLPLKKINCMCQIEKDRLLRFLIKYQQIKPQDKDSVILEFYDFFNQRYVQEKDVTISNNIFQFSEKFLGLPESKVLKVAIYYNFSYTNLIELYQSIEMFKLDQKIFQEEKIKYQNQLEEYEKEFLEMKDTLKEIQQTLLLTEKQQEQQQKNVDIVILYSNPIIRVNNGIRESLFIDYESEIKSIKNVIIRSDQSIKYEIFNASIKNLEKAISLHPLIIHVISHGDFDEKQQIFYLEFQDDGVSTKLKTDEIQKMIQNNKGMARIQLICISSIVGKNISDYIPKTVSCVVFQKLYNIIDNEGPYFWEEFYQNIFKNFSVGDAYEKAQQKLENAFWDNEKKYVCCCFHKHEPKCPFDPAQIGYESSHQQHLKCAKQKWVHSSLVMNPCDPSSYQGQLHRQCNNNCLGRLILDCKHKKCQQQIYDQRIDDILQKLQIDQIDKETLNTNLVNILDKKLICCCCEQLNIILETQSENISSFIASQHTYDQKIQFKKENNVQFLEHIEQNKDQIQDIQFMTIDKQIILVHSKDPQDKVLEVETLQTINTYIKIYIQEKYKKEIKKFKESKKIKENEPIEEIVINLNGCDVNNWIEIVSKKLNLEHASFDEFLIKSKDYFCNLQSQDNFFYIFTIQNISNICESDQFQSFYQVIQEANESNFILILPVDNTQKENLKKITAVELVQFIDLKQIYSLLQEEKN
ncbi:unnamed protein product [Paramecium sonneborni]|uniref:Uncharacterized protein n=1 Tax=Paramecium sonneborni TaxID=65129 RepID=A0A8S1MP19_9CILI|nr:unnamed protein product [Paramecium sonneborni]